MDNFNLYDDEDISEPPAWLNEPPTPDSLEEYCGNADQPGVAHSDSDLQDEAAAPAPKPAKAKPARAAPPADDEDLKENPYFRVLGHLEGRIYIYQYEGKVITSRTFSDWGEAALTSIAPLHWWELNFPGDKGLNKKLAVNWLQRLAFRKRTFDPNAERGRGAWRDRERVVFHFGWDLSVDGEVIGLDKVDSDFFYSERPKLPLPAVDGLNDDGGKALFNAFKLWRWERPEWAILAAGWCVLAPLSGVLRWRPHIWVTGGTGSGKTSLLNFVHWLMGGVDLYANGNSTEAGLRQELRIDALPVLFDESEQNNDREAMRIQNVLSLIRQASTETGARTYKGTAGGASMHFLIRSMFCLGSVSVGIKHQADVERISVLPLKPKLNDGAEASKAAAAFESALGGVMANDSLPRQLLRRSIDLLPTILDNIKVFTEAATDRFGTRRDGDQYGALMAGAWSLISSTPATIDEARAMISRYTWETDREDTQTEEGDKAVAHVLARKIRVMGREASVFELVARAAGRNIGFELDADEANRNLGLHGMKVEMCRVDKNTRAKLPDVFLIAYKHPGLDELMDGSPYAADLKGHLLRVKVAGRDKGRFTGTQSRAVSLPLEYILDRDEQPEDDDFDDIVF